MCHHAHIRVLLTEDDRKDLKKLSGIMIPTYASVLLAIIAVVALTGGSRHGELIASATTSSGAR
jgi:hypothetical protein